MRLSHKILMIAFLSSAALVGPAHAEDEEVPAAVQALLDSIERQTTIAPTYESIETDDEGTVTLKNLAIKKAASGEEPGMDATFAEAVFSNIDEEAKDGVYQIGEAKFSNLQANIAGKDFSLKITMPEASAEGWYVAEESDEPTAEEQARATMNVARKMTAGKMTFEGQGQTVTVDGYESTWDGDPKTGSGTFSSKLSNIHIPQSLIALADQGGMLKQLGYTDLSFDISGGGKTEVVNGLMNVTFDGGLSARDMGAFKLGFTAGGVPLAVVAALQKAQKEGKEPDFNALMPQVQEVTFSGLSLRFEDASITKKLLPMAAAMQGMDEKALIASVGPMVQMGLAQLQNQAFAEQAAKAVNSFLAEPKSLTVSAKPAAPLKVSEIMTLNPQAPGEAITKLGVSVSAND